MQSFLDDRMQPGKQEVESRPLTGGLLHTRWRRHSVEGRKKIGSDSWGRFEDEDAASSEQVDGDLAKN